MDTQNHPLLELAEIAKQLSESQEGIKIYEDEETRTIDIDIVELLGTAYSQKNKLFTFTRSEAAEEISYKTDHVTITLYKNSGERRIVVLGEQIFILSSETRRRRGIPEDGLIPPYKFSIFSMIKNETNLAVDDFSYNETQPNGPYSKRLEKMDAITYTEGICRNIVDSLRTCLPNPELHSELHRRVQKS